jgi:energy-coupling factor transporter ATP-binding protein EcfA2
MPLDDVVTTFRRWLFLPDVSPLYAVLGTVAANLLDGDPVWLLLVGPSGSGKSEILQAVGGLPSIHAVATMTEASLLSGSPKRDHADDASGGLLRSIGERGIMLCKDFGSVLSMNRDARAQVLAALREVYDGSWTRHVGVDGGRTLAWSGRVGLVAGCTPTIDKHHAVMGAMGERFILFRLSPIDAAEQGRRALAHAGRETGMRSDLAGAVEELFRNGAPLEPGKRTDADDERLIRLATLVVRCRSAVERDGYRREIELVPGAEAPTRLVVVLARLLAGLDAIGCPRDKGWQVVTKAALDSIPEIRRDAIEVLYLSGLPVDTGSIAESLGYPKTTTRRALEDLTAYGIAIRDRGGDGKADRWSLSEFTSELYATARTVPEKLQGANNPSSSFCKALTDKSGKVTKDEIEAEEWAL